MKNTPDPDKEIPRHTLSVRLIHWLIALTFVAAMVTGLTLYWNSILGWLLPYLGGKQGAIAIRFVGGLALSVFAVPMFFLWRKRMSWTATDTYFIRNVREHGMSPNQTPPPDTGFFNGGQKLYFWAFILSTAWLLVTCLVWWWRREPWMPK